MNTVNTKTQNLKTTKSVLSGLKTALQTKRNQKSRNEKLMYAQILRRINNLFVDNLTKK